MLTRSSPGASTLAPIAALVDLLLLLIALVIAGILITGGGEVSIVQHRIRAHSIVNPLLIFAAVAIIRYAWIDRPFTFRSRLDRRGLKTAAALLLDAAWVKLTAIDAAGARRWVLAAAAISFALKLANIIWQPGFYSGDDVEIHEMTLGLLFQRDWPIWNLRSPVFPVGFIYPAQWAVRRLGVTDITVLVAAGRLIVAIFSTFNILLLCSVARRHWQSLPIGVLAAMLLCFSGLHIQFGSSELPRTVATTFLLAAVWLIQEAGHRRGFPHASIAAAGALIGLAGAIRFSEAMFLAPAALSLFLTRRAAAAAGAGIDAGPTSTTARAGAGAGVAPAAASLLLIAAGLATYVGLLCFGDSLYWGSPFHSGRHVIQFTLVDRLSTRGYQPWHFYLSQVFVWSNPFVLAAVVTALASAARTNDDVRTCALLWLGIPLLLLSVLPHKEPRYLLPILPFWSAIAACGVWRAIERWRASRSPRRPLFALTFLSLLIAGALVEADRFRFRRSSDALQAMRLAVSHQPKGIAFEEAWTGGGRLYTERARLIELQFVTPQDAVRSAATTCGDASIDWVVLRNRPLARAAARALQECGFSAVSSPHLPATYLAFTHAGR